MGKTAPLSVRLQPELNDQLTALAATLDRPRSWVIEQALRDYVALHAWQAAAIEAGVQAADAGQVIGHDAVADWVRSWGSADEQPAPECK